MGQSFDQSRPRRQDDEESKDNRRTHHGTEAPGRLDDTARSRSSQTRPEDETLREMRTTPVESPQDEWMDESGHGTEPYPEYPDSTDEDVAQGPQDAVEFRERDQSTIPQQMPMQNMGSLAGKLHPGLAVTGADGETVGEIKEIRENDFLVERSGATDIYVPFQAVRAVSEIRAALDVRSDEIDRQGWARPRSGRPPAALHPK